MYFIFYPIKLEVKKSTNLHSQTASTIGFGNYYINTYTYCEKCNTHWFKQISVKVLKNKHFKEIGEGQKVVEFVPFLRL